MQDYKRIDQSLEKLRKDFNTQIEALSKDDQEFHNALIDLSSKYPDHKELLQFIVFINDKLETNQTLFSGVFTDSLNDLMHIKQTMVQKIIDENENKTVKASSEDTVWGKVKNTANLMNNAKMIMTALAVILLAAGVIMAPQMFLAVIKELIVLL